MLESRRDLVRFLGVATIIVAGLLIVSPWAGAGYAAVFRGVGEVLWAGTNDDLRVRFEPADDAARPQRFDTTVTIHHVRRQLNATFPIRAAGLGYLPTAFALGLALAAPATWRRRLVGAAVLLGVMFAYASFRVWLLVMHRLSLDTPVQTYDPSGAAGWLLEAAMRAFVYSPVTPFVLAIAAWLTVFWRRPVPYAEETP